jgi:thiol:disulfide interchange protein DsbC
MRLTSLAATLAVGLSLATTSACGADAAKDAAATRPDADVKAEIAKRLEISPESIRPAPVPGLWEVSSGTDVGYVSQDGRYYIDGDVFDMQTRVNVTDQRRKGARAEVMKAVKDSDAIVFAPKDVKYTIDVFTDVDCTYCRKLHAEIAELNRMGVKVRYLMFPRSGPGSPAWKQAEAVWCSADRNDALTRAKRGEKVTAAACDDSVADQYRLGREVGINATPAIITENGDLIAGYMPAPRMVERLKALAGQG